MQVLIVDDDMATVDVIKNSVKWKELGVSDIFTAYNIQLAKEILKEHNIDIVISDIVMPGGTGFDHRDLESICWSGFGEKSFREIFCF